MSHFSVIVITPTKPSQEELAEILQPWHEYESTGTKDKYVVDVDITDEVEEQFNEPCKVVVLPVGTVYSHWDDRFYTKKPRESWQNKEFELPEGAVEKEMSADEARKYGIGYATMAECAKDYFGGFEQNGRYFRTTNQNKKWDWWQVGGRWTGLLVPNYDASKENNGKWPTEWKKLDGDQMRLGDVPIARLRAVAREQAAEKYDKVHKIVAGRKLPTWDGLLDLNGEDYANARDAYNNDPVIKDLHAAKLGLWGSFDEYAVDRDTYLKQAEDAAFVPFAVVKDGKWYERGEMGWWCMVHDEKDQNLWNQEFNKLIDGLPADTWLTVVDCHI